jgi:hypothetical protein
LKNSPNYGTDVANVIAGSITVYNVLFANVLSFIVKILYSQKATLVLVLDVIKEIILQ